MSLAATTKHELTTTTSTGAACAIRSTTTAVPAFADFWWGQMTELGWNRSSYDLASHLASTHSRGFLMACEHSDGPPKGFVMAAVFDNSTAWVTMFVVAADLRRSGFGRVLFDCVMDDFRTHETRYVGLDGVQEQVPTYGRRGFQTSPQGGIKMMSRDFVAKTPLPAVTVPERMTFKKAAEVDPSWIVAFEKKITGFQRSGLWTKSYFARPDLQGLVLLDASETGPESIAAFALIRRCESGARFAPLYARDSHCAEAVMAKVLELATPAFVKDCPLPGVEMSEWSEQDISQKASFTAEVWTGNAQAESLFDKFGWRDDKVGYVRMWLDGRAPPEQSEGGLAHRTMFAIYDAAIG